MDTFSAMDDTNAFDGVEQTTANDLAGCMSACLKDDSCTAFDFVGTGCWLFMSKVDKTYTSIGVRHYTRVSCIKPTGKQLVLHI